MKNKILLLSLIISPYLFFFSCRDNKPPTALAQPNRNTPARSIFPVSANPVACKESEIYYNMITNQFLVCTEVNTLSVVSFGGSGSGAIMTLNGLTNGTQVFAVGAAGNTFNISSSGSTHTFNIPVANGVNQGLLSTTDWLIFNNKQPALGFTPENIANKDATNGYAGLTSGKITLSQLQEVLDITDLTDYATVSGTGTTAIKATFTSLTTNDCLLWDGTNWVNSNTCASGATGITSINSLSAASQTIVTGTSGSDFNIDSTSSTHTLNIPSASASNRGLLLAADWTTFNNKQVALGFTPENSSNKNATNGYAGLSSGKITTSQITELLGIGDLTDFSGKSGSGVTAIGATITSVQTNDCLIWDGVKWINSASCGGGGSSGITTLNSLTALTQTFAVGTSGSNFNIASSGTTHTFNLPTASATIRGALSTADWSTFNSKQNALGFTPENSANKNATNGYAGLSSGKLILTQMQEVMSISDLSDYVGKSGTGTTAIGATLSSLTVNDCLKWNGTTWINSACGSGGSGDMILSATQTVTGAKTFNVGTLIFGTFAGTPSVTANSFYRNTSDGKLYVGAANGSSWNELFEAGVSLVNLTSNVTGTLPNTNGGRTKAAGVPTGSCTTGDLYTRTDGGVGSTLYVCEGGSWSAK